MSSGMNINQGLVDLINTNRAGSPEHAGDAFNSALSKAKEDGKVTAEEAKGIADALNVDRQAAGQGALSREDYIDVALNFMTKEADTVRLAASADGNISRDEAVSIAHARNRDFMALGEEAVSHDEFVKFVEDIEGDVRSEALSGSGTTA